MRRPRPAMVVLALSLTALGTTVVVAGASYVAASSAPGVTGSVGERPSAAASAPSSVPVPAATTSEVGPSTVGPGFRELPQPSVDAGVPPALVSIPSIGVRSTVAATGIDADGTTEVPDDVDVLGWYKFGSAPGDPGSTVIIGHRDGRGQGRGALYSLGAVGVGDPITLTLADGTRMPYRVVAREVLERRSVPLDEIFARSGEPRLTVISCGGVYDAARGGYQSNVLVTAVPLDRELAGP